MKRTLTAFLSALVLSVVALPAAAQSGFLQYGAAISGDVTAAVPSRLVHFNGQAGDAISITARGDALLRVTLLSPSLTQLAVSSAAAQAQITQTLPETGVYHLVVARVGGASGEFTLLLESAGPASPVLLRPEDGAILPFTGSLTFTWEPVPGTVAYLIEREACNAAFTNCVPLVPVITDQTSVTIEHNDTRPARWRVRSTFTDGTQGPFSDWATFSFDLRPVLLRPEDGAILPLTGSLTFTWEPVPGTVAYLIEREACNAAFTDCVPLVPVITDQTSVTIEHNDTRPARWRVRSTFADGTQGPFSDWATFSFDLRPVLLRPEDGAILPLTNSLTFAWEPVPGTVAYLIEREACNAAYTDCTPMVPVTTDQTSVTIEHNDTRPARWRVRSTFTDGTQGPFSDWATFSFASPTATPQPETSALVGTAWQLTALAAGQPALPDVVARLEFREEGAAVGSGGCNGFSATYAISAQTISFDAFLALRAFCGPEIAAQETAYFAALENASSFVLSGEQLFISYAGQFMTFARLDASQVFPTLPPQIAITLAPTMTPTTEAIPTLPPQIAITLAPTATSTSMVAPQWIEPAGSTIDENTEVTFRWTPVEGALSYQLVLEYCWRSSPPSSDNPCQLWYQRDFRTTTTTEYTWLISGHPTLNPAYTSLYVMAVLPDSTTASGTRLGPESERIFVLSRRETTATPTTEAILTLPPQIAITLAPTMTPTTEAIPTLPPQIAITLAPTMTPTPTPTGSPPQNPPGLREPANGALIPLSTTVTFLWNPVSGASRYVLERELCQTAISNCTPLTPTVTDATSITLAHDSPAVTRWRVRAGFPDGTEGPFSAWRTFSFDRRPVLLQPEDGALVVQLSNQALAFAWQPLPGAVSYRLEREVCQADFSGCSPLSGGIVSASQTSVNVAQPYGAARWRVQALDAQGVAGPFSDWSSFTFLSAFPNPVPLHLADNGIVPLADTVTFTWESVPGAPGYLLEYEYCPTDSQLCTPASMDLVITTDTSFTRPPATRYPSRWRVWTMSATSSWGGNVPWNNFTYDLPVPPPVQLQPLDGAMLPTTGLQFVTGSNDVFVDFAWQAVPGAVRYRLEREYLTGIWQPYLPVIDTAETSIRAGNPYSRTRWRVYAIAEDGTMSLHSPWADFRFGTPTATPTTPPQVMITLAPTATLTAAPLTAATWSAPIQEYTIVDANNPGVLFRWEPVVGATSYRVYMQICESPTPTNDCPAFAETGYGPITETEWQYVPPAGDPASVYGALPNEAQMRVFYVAPVGVDADERGPRSGPRYVIYQPGLFATPTPRELEPTLPPHPTSTATPTPIVMERVTSTPTFTPTSAPTEDPASGITGGDLLLQLGLGVSALSFELAWPPNPVNHVNIRAVVGDAALREAGITYELRLECTLAAGDNVQWVVFGASGPSLRTCGDLIPLAFGPNRLYWDMQVSLDRPEGPVTKTLRLVAAPVDAAAPMLAPLDLMLSYDRPVSTSGMVSFPQGMRDTQVNLLLPARDALPAPARFEVTVSCAGRIEPLRWNILNTIDIHQPPGFDSGPQPCGATIPFAYSEPETVPYISVWYDWPAAQSSANFTVTVRHIRPAPSATPSATLSPTPEPERPTETLMPSETARPTDIPLAAPDRDFAIRVNAAEGARFSNDVSYPDGDTSDLISVTLDALPQRGETLMQFALECAGVGVESLRWQVRGVSGELGCGALARVPFSASASQQTVVVSFDRSARQSYVAYTLSITPP